MHNATVHFHVNVAQVIAISGLTASVLYFLNRVDASAKRFHRSFASELYATRFG